MGVKKITNRVVAELQPGRTIWDETVKGFGVRRQRRAAVYVFKFRYNGRQRFMTIGRHGSPWTPEDARSAAKRYLGTLANKERPRDPAAERDIVAAQSTFANFSERYLTEFAAPRKKARSLAEDRRNLQLHILPALGGMRLSEIGRADVARFHSAQHARPVNANRCLALISHIFTIAEKWDVIESGTNPCRGLNRYPERSRERFLGREELMRLGQALSGAATGGALRAENWRTVACIHLLIYTGARLNEILSLQWQWINWEGGFARLPDSKIGPKNLPLPEPALALLHELQENRRHDGLQSRYVLPSERGNSYFTGIQKPWQRIRTAAGLDDLRIHDLRHCYASVAVAGGESLYLVGTILGHRHSATTQRYAHLAMTPILEVANRTAGRLAALLGPRQPSHPSASQESS